MKIQLGTTPRIYKIDWDKIQTVEDIKRVFQFFNITISESFKGAEEIKDLLILCEEELK